MDFKSLLSQLDQLNEATEKTKTGLKHTAEPGGYGRKDDEDDEGKKVKADAPKKGRGRPKKNADSESGEEKKYDTKGLAGVFGGGKAPKSAKKGTVIKGKSQSHAANKVDDGTDPGEEPKSKKKGLKEYFDSLDKALLEAEQVTIQPAQSNTQVIKQGTKTLGTVTNPQLAQQIKQSIGRGEMSLAGPGGKEEMAEEGEGKWIQKAVKHPGAFTKKAQAAGKSVAAFAKEKAHAPGTLGKQARLAQTLRKISKTNEADMPPNDSLMSPISEQGVAEGKKKPDANKNGIPDYAEDGKGKNDLKKKKVDEGMNHRLQAARLEGKSHGLKGHAYAGKNYDDMEEARHYHEGYKEGLDECYGQLPIIGQVVGEEDMTPATVPGMASQADGLDEMDRSEWMKHKAEVTPGDKFNAFGQTIADKEVLESPFAFEAWDKELNALLESKEEVTEGMTVSISKGQQGAPDSVSVSAQDQDADQLLALIKQAGLGLFGGDEAPQQAQPMTVDTGEPAEVGTGGVEIGVVDDHDGMMNLIKKVTGAEPKGPEGGFADQGGEEDGQDYEEEGGHKHEEGGEDTCEGCGMEESACQCDHEEAVEEDETMNQREEEVAEDQTEEEETSADENAEAAEDEASANYDRGEQEAEGASYKAAAEEEKDLDESYANGADDTFETDINFMTKVISGGLNKEKVQRKHGYQQGDNPLAMHESVADWKKLAGIK